MSDATKYLENMTLNAVLRGETFTPPAALWLALHTGDPGEDGNQLEVLTANYPDYVRMNLTYGGGRDSGFPPAVDGAAANLKPMVYAVFTGMAPLTVTHFSIWDAQYTGRAYVKGAFTAPRTVNSGDVFVVDIGRLTIRVQ